MGAGSLPRRGARGSGIEILGSAIRCRRTGDSSLVHQGARVHQAIEDGSIDGELLPLTLPSLVLIRQRSFIPPATHLHPFQRINVSPSVSFPLFSVPSSSFGQSVYVAIEQYTNSPSPRNDVQLHVTTPLATLISPIRSTDTIAPIHQYITPSSYSCDIGLI